MRFHGISLKEGNPSKNIKNISLHAHKGGYDFFGGTFAPFFRASERPMAIACFRLVTLPPLPPLPDRSVPRFSRAIAFSTLFPAAFPYFAMLVLLKRIEFQFAPLSIPFLTRSATE
jgi:hypothetical protein